MITEEFTYLSNDKIHEIHAVEWRPEDEPASSKAEAPDKKTGPKAVLQIIHGMGEYKERYAEFAAYLCRHGFIVVMHDQLGHGDTAVSPEERGYFTDISRGGGSVLDPVLEDIRELKNRTREKYPKLPYFMLGHSMGSYFLRSYLIRYENRKEWKHRAKDAPELTGAVIMGTGFVSPRVTVGGLILLRTLVFLRGWHFRSRLIQKIATGSGPYKQFDSTGKEPEKSWLSKNKASVIDFYSNPKSNILYTLNGYEGLLEAVLLSCRRKSCRKLPKDLPVLLVSGENDPVGDMGEGVKTLYRHLRRAGMRRVTMHFFKGDRHEILQETDRRKVYRYIDRWIGRVLS